jgi:hypothetical protein
MRAGPRFRKLLLTLHIITSMGLVGAVASFLALAIVGLSVGAGGPPVYPAMDLVTGYLIVPLALMSLAIGTFQSLVTPWGLIRHYWVVVKLILTLVVMVVLWMQTGNIRMLAMQPIGADGPEMAAARASMVLHAGGGLLVLLGAVILSVYKPRGLTRFGGRRRGVSNCPDIRSSRFAAGNLAIEGLV